MGFGFSRPRCSPIGIDLGAARVKLLQVVPGDPPRLIAAASARVPTEAREDASARRAFLGERLKELLKKGGFKGRRAILSFPAFETLTQHLEIRPADGLNLDSQVHVALREAYEIDPQRMVIRHFPVRQTTREGVTFEELICLAAPRQVVMGYVEVARACRLDVVGMHAEPLALLKSFEHLHSRRTDSAAPTRATCFIDLGAAMTKIVIAHGSRMVFAKNIHVGGEAMSQRTQSTGADADCHRIDSITPPDGEGGEGQPMNAESMACVVDELQLCLRYHQRLFPDQPMEKLVFVGGASRRTATCQAIAKAVRVAAQLGDPFARVTRTPRPPRRSPAAAGVRWTHPPRDEPEEDGPAALDGPQPAWAVPLGLCLSEANL